MNLVHDEIVIECTSAAYLEMAANKIQECMEMAGAVFVSKLPMPANPEIVNYWKH